MANQNAMQQFRQENTQILKSLLKCRFSLESIDDRGRTPIDIMMASKVTEEEEDIEKKRRKQRWKDQVAAQRFKRVQEEALDDASRGTKKARSQRFQRQ